MVETDGGSNEAGRRQGLGGVVKAAFADIRDGLRHRRIWLALASEDIWDQYRGTLLGPLWMLVNYFALIAIFLFLFQRGGGVANFPTYAAVGLAVYTYVSETITHSLGLFSGVSNFIKGTRLPLTVYVMRQTMQGVIRASYTVAGALAIMLFTEIYPAWPWLWSLLGLGVILLTVPATTIVFAMIGTYFPDSRYILSNIMRIGMFVTPVFWVPETRGGIRLFYDYNPFTHFIEIVREPIMLGAPPLRSLAISLAICVGLWVVAILLLGSLRRKVVFVL